MELLQFYQSLLQIVSLEYGMGRNNAPGAQVLTLEGAVLSGVPFWQQKQGLCEQHKDPESLRNAPERVVAKIVNARRAKIDLAEDLTQIAVQL